MRLRTAIVLVCLILSLVGTFYGGYSRYNTSQEIIIEQTYENFENIAKLKKLQIESFIDAEKEKVEMLKLCSLIPEILNTEFNSSEYWDIYPDVKDKLQEIGKGSAIFNLEGILMASENNPPGINQSFYLQGDFDLKIVNYYDPIRKKDYLGIILPFFDELYDEKQGFIGFDIESEKLSELVLEGIDLGETGEIYLVDKDKVLISYSRFLENGIFVQEVNTVHSKNCFEKNYSLGKKDSFIDYRGEEVFGSYEYFEDIGWCLFVEINKKELFEKSIKRLIYSSILISLIIVFFITLLGFFVGEYFEKIYLNKRKKGKFGRKKGKFEKKISKFSCRNCLIFAILFATAYFFIVTSFFQGWQNAKFFDAIPDLLIFIVAFMILIYGIRLKNGRAKPFILWGGGLICLRRLLDVPFQEYQEIVGLLNVFIWWPILIFEFAGLILLLIGYRRLKT